MSTNVIQHINFSLYTKIDVDIFTKKTNKKTSRFNNVTFYIRKYYIAHLSLSNYIYLYNKVDLAQFAKDSQTDSNKHDDELQPGEWIQDMHDYNIVCLIPAKHRLETIRSGNGLFDERQGKQIDDAYAFLDKKGYHLVCSL